MDVLMLVLVFIFTYIFFYYVFTAIVVVPSEKSKRVLSRIIRQKDLSKKSFIDKLSAPLTKVIIPVIRIDSYKRNKLSRNLARVGISDTPEEYTAKALAKGILISLFSVVFIYLGIPIATLATFFLGITVAFKEMQVVNDKLKKINALILNELPRFVSTYNHSLEGTKDIIRIFEKYRKVAGQAFRYDLDVLIMELKSGNMEEALRRFDDRINIPQLSTFISGVIGTSKGIDQKTFFFMMEQNMKVLYRENMKREMAKRPGKLKLATISVGVCMFLIYVVPMGLQLKTGLAIFK
jgi:hypothetical protein